MASTEVWIITIIGMLSSMAIGYLLIKKVLPKIRDATDLAIKDHKITEGLMIIFFFYIGLFVIRKMLETITATNEAWVKYITAIKPGIDVLTDLLPYVGIFMIAVVIAVAIRIKIKP